LVARWSGHYEQKRADNDTASHRRIPAPPGDLHGAGGCAGSGIGSRPLSPGKRWAAGESRAEERGGLPSGWHHRAYDIRE